MKRRKVPDSKRGWIAIVILIGLGVLVYWRADKSDKKDVSRRRHMKLTNAFITGCEDGSRGAVSFKYRYWVNGKQYEGSDGSTKIYQDYEKHFTGKRIPLVYDSTDPGNCYLLITPDCYPQFDLVFPDSMAWEKQYLKGDGF